jgi:hypothetical protein
MENLRFFERIKGMSNTNVKREMARGTNVTAYMVWRYIPVIKDKTAVKNNVPACLRGTSGRLSLNREYSNHPQG